MFGCVYEEVNGKSISRFSLGRVFELGHAYSGIFLDQSQRGRRDIIFSLFSLITHRPHVLVPDWSARHAQSRLVFVQSFAVCSRKCDMLDLIFVDSIFVPEEQLHKSLRSD